MKIKGFFTTQIFCKEKRWFYHLDNSNYTTSHFFAQFLRQCDVAILIMIHALFVKKLNGNLLKKRTTPCEKMTCFKKFKEEFIQACHEIILYYLYAYENYLQVYNHFHEQKCFLLLIFTTKICCIRNTK